MAMEDQSIKQNSTQSLRITHKVTRTEDICFTFNHQPIQAHKGETIAIALLANGIRTLGHNLVDGSNRGLFCAMGICQQCVVQIDGRNVEACRTYATQDIQVFSTTPNNINESL